MSARLGFATQKGLGEALNAEFSKGLSRYIVFFLVIGAILIGNAAYEAGNISGGVLGMDLLLGKFRFWPLIIGCICFLLLFFGKYKWVERILISLVIIMSLCFLITAIMVKPNIGDIFKGFIPTVNSSNFLVLIMALIGTTVVPYNLFLHASTISKKWSKEENINELRMENAISIIIGGLISILIVITAASTQGSIQEVQSAIDLALQ